MSNSSSIRCDDLYKSYIEGELHVEVLRGINLNVEKGQCVGIIGSSGSGKSTLLHLLGGLDEPTRGSVSIEGEMISNLPEKKKGQLRNKSLGFIYQFHHLLPEFNALENVAMPLLIRGMDVSEAEAMAANMLGKVGLKERVRHKPGELSGGERQRAAIARALVTRPACILADEPTGNLDEKTASLVFDTILELNREYDVSLVMVTHNQNLAKQMDQVLELQSGVLE